MNRLGAFPIAMGVTGIAADAFSAWCGVNFCQAWGIAAIASVLNGWLAAVEDDWPGGFNDPKKGA